ncbi:MAG: hypothetical protein ACO1Q7_03515 [Gemmatimonas sp.]
MTRLPQSLASLAMMALLGLAAACTRSEPADSVELIGGATPCNGCRVQLGPPLELRMENGASGVNTSPIAIAADSGGRFWVAQLGQPGRVFDANGEFLGNIGQTGTAESLGVPVALMALPGDSMLVFDVFGGVQRAFVFDSLRRAVRMLRLPGVLRPGLAAAWPASVLLTGPVGGTSSADSTTGWSMHLVNASQESASVQKSFGPARLPDSLARTLSAFQRTAAANDSGYWAADILRYRLSHFAKDGTLITTIERSPEWFGAPSADNMGTPTTPPPPKLFAVWQAPDGLLWVFGRVAGRSWKEAWPALPPGANTVDISALRFDKMFGTVVEIVDPVSRNVITSATLDEFITEVLPNGNVAVFAVDSARGAGLSVRRISLAR